ncbi:hypothetical protein GYMLUDRAFT_170497, partial [Collybiopsis luxurians FD-317 M1]
TFTCGICFEVFPDEDIALVEKCSHKFCREYLQSYTLFKIHDRRFPIVCPTCMSDAKACPDPGMIEQGLIEQMNISQEDYEILEETMLSQYCIPLHCSKCSRTFYVDREDYHQEQSTIECPLPGCTHVWCKHCNQSVNNGVTQHSCDGTKELIALMREQGWKVCPGCDTNIQKTEGCNHIVCRSPGCNMNFCYRCGKSIIQSTLRQEVQNAVGLHYEICRLFDHDLDSDMEDDYDSEHGDFDDAHDAEGGTDSDEDEGEDEYDDDNSAGDSRSYMDEDSDQDSDSDDMEYDEDDDYDEDDEDSY